MIEKSERYRTPFFSNQGWQREYNRGERNNKVPPSHPWSRQDWGEEIRWITCQDESMWEEDP